MVSYLKKQVYKFKCLAGKRNSSEYYVYKIDLGVDIGSKDFEYKLTAVQAKFYKNDGFTGGIQYTMKRVAFPWRYYTF